MILLGLILLGLAATFFLLSLLMAKGIAGNRIGGSYNRSRLRPDQIDAKLRGSQFLQRLIWIGIVLVSVPTCVVLQFLNEDFIPEGGVGYTLLYEPFSDVDWPLSYIFSIFYL